MPNPWVSLRLDLLIPVNKAVNDKEQLETGLEKEERKNLHLLQPPGGFRGLGRDGFAGLVVGGGGRQIVLGSVLEPILSLLLRLKPNHLGGTDVVICKKSFWRFLHKFYAKKSQNDWFLTKIANF
jgi:hypothetical protein